MCAEKHTAASLRTGIACHPISNMTVRPLLEKVGIRNRPSFCGLLFHNSHGVLLRQVRGDFGRVTGRNIVHASDSPENGEREAGAQLHNC